MTSQSHSLLSPSSAARWVACPGSIFAENCITQETSQAALDGTHTHKIGAELIDLGLRGLFPDNWRDVENKYELESSFLYAAHQYAKNILGTLRTLRIFGGKNLGIEDKIAIPSINENCFGTCDFWAYDTTNNILIVADFKTGLGIVEPFENWQLICYTCGVLYKLGTINLSNLKIYLRIVQPRAPHYRGPIRQWNTTYDMIIKNYLPILAFKASIALSEKPYLQTGPHCRYCSARYRCDQLQMDAALASDYVGTPMPQNFDSKMLGREIQFLEDAQRLITYRLEAIKEIALKEHRPIDGYRFAPGRGSVQWKPDLDQNILAQLAASNNVDLWKHDLITPKQAIDAGLDKNLVKQLSVKIPGKMRLVRDKGDLAKEIFNG